MEKDLSQDGLRLAGQLARQFKANAREGRPQAPLAPVAPIDRAPLPEGVEPLPEGVDALPDGVQPLPEGVQPVPEPPDDDRLALIYHAATRAQNENHAEVIEISKRTGLPPAVVRQKLPEFRAKIEASKFDPARFRAENPALAKMIEQKPQLAPVLANDKPALSAVEWVLAGGPFRGISKLTTALGDAAYKGNLETDLSQIAIKQRNGTATPEDLIRADSIESTLQGLKDHDLGVVPWMFEQAVQQMPRYLRSAGEISQHAAVGLAGGTAIGSVVPGIGTVAGGLTGMGAGALSGVAATSGRDEGALFYRDAIKEGIDPAVAEVGAKWVSVINGSLEAAPLEKVLRVVPGVRALQGKMTNDVFRKLLKSPTIKAAALRAAGRMAEGSVFEGITEFAQELAPQYQMTRAKGGTVSQAISDIDWSQAWEAGKAGAGAAGGMHLASPGVHIEIGNEIREANRAKNNAAMWQALGEPIKDSKTFKSMPAEAKEFVSDVQKQHGVVEQVSVPAEALRDTIAGMTPEEIEEQIPEVAKALASAQPGDEVAVKTADMSVIARQPGYEALTQDIRLGDNPTAREAPEVLKQAKAVKEEMDQRQTHITSLSEAENKLVEAKDALAAEESVTTEAPKFDSATTAREASIAEAKDRIYSALKDGASDLDFAQLRADLVKAYGVADERVLVNGVEQPKVDPRTVERENKLAPLRADVLIAQAKVDAARATAEKAKAVQPAFKVYEEVRQNLIDKLKMSPEVASTNAALWQAFVNSRSERLGVDPVAYWKSLGVTFDQGELSDLTKKDQKAALAQAIPPQALEKFDAEVAPLRERLAKLDARSEEAAALNRQISEKADALLREVGAQKSPGLLDRVLSWVKGGEPDVLLQAEAQTDSAPFKKWFGASKIVDAEGQPLIVYHKTTGDFDVFQRGKKGTSGNYLSGPGIWLAPSPDKTHAAHNVPGNSAPGANIMPLYVRIEKPLEIGGPLRPGEKQLSYEERGARGLPTSAAYITEEEVGSAKAAGYDGIIQYGENGRVMEYVAFDPEQIKSATGNDGTFDANDPSVLSQSTEGGARGFFLPKYLRITLTGKANLSTFVHESGHAFLEILRREAESGHEQSRADLAILSEWLGRKPDAKRWTRDQLETFARGLEAYTWEGKAPSEALAHVFQTIKGWMRYLYSTLRGLDVELTDEVRGVMDRLLATDTEIAKAKDIFGLVPPEDPEGLMDPESFAKYRTAFALGLQKASERADRDSLREFRRAVGEEHAALKKQLAKVADADQALNAREAILTGKRLDGEPVPAFAAGQKLSLEWAKENGIPVKGNLRGLFVSGGIDPDVVAPAYGYMDTERGGIDLVAALSAKPSKEAWIRQEAERRMAEKYPGFTNSRSWNAENAARALHIDEVANAIWAGMKGLNARLGGKLETSARYAIKEAARTRVEDMALWEMTPGKAQREEARAAREVVDAWKKRDVKAAYEATRKQLFNHYKYAAVVEGKEIGAKVKEYLDSFDGESARRKIATAGQHYLDLIDGIRGQLGLTDKKGNLAESYAQVVAAGNLPLFSLGQILDLPGDFNDLTLSQVKAVKTVVENVAHIAKTAGQLIINERRESLEAVASQLAAHIEANRPPVIPNTPAPPGAPPLPPDEMPRQNPSWWDRSKGKFTVWGNHLKKIEFLSRELDGGKTAGLAWNHIFHPLVDAEVRESQMIHDLFRQLQKLEGTFTRSERWGRDSWVTFIDRRIQKRDVFSIALNLRNEGNIAHLLGTTGWTREQVLSEIDRVLSDERDIALVNEFGRMAGQYWEEIKRVYKAHKGVEPTEVKGPGVTLPSGRVIEGGYYPIIKDRTKIAMEMVDVNSPDLWGGGDYLPVATPHGFTEERAGGSKVPLLLSMDALPYHLVRVIHYVTHYEATRAVDKLTQHPLVKGTIVDGLGKEPYDQIRPWLLSIAQDSDVGAEPLVEHEKLFRQARLGSSVVLLFAKTATAAKQLLGITTSLKEFGMSENGIQNPALAGKYAAIGIKEYLKTLVAGEPFQYIADRDATWVLHKENYDRDMRLAYRSILSAYSDLGKARASVLEMAFSLFNAFQGTVNAITWHGALQKALDEGHPDPVSYASATVRMTQAAGGLKDLAAMQRGSEWKKMWTIMYSWKSVLFNQLAERQPAHLGWGTKARNASLNFLYLATLPAMLGMWLSGGDDSGDVGEEAKKIAVESLLFASGSVPVVESLARSAATGQRPRVTPWLDMLADVAITAGNLPGQDFEFTDEQLRDLIEGTGVVTQLPTAGLWNGVEYVSEFGNMDEPVMNLLFRSPRQAR